MANEIKINEKVVIISSKENWSYDGISSDKLKELNESLFTEVQEKVTYYLDNKEKIEAEQRQKEKEEVLQKNLIAHNKFKKMFQDTYGEQLKELNVTFYPPKLDDYNHYNPRRVDIQGFEIYYDDEVYHSGSWHASSTSKVWVLRTRDYKTIRYASLASAVTKCIERVEDYISQSNHKQEREQYKQHAENAMKDFAEDNGFEYSKNHHSSYSHRGYGKGYYTYSMEKGNVTVEIVHNEEEDKVKIVSYTVKKDNITVDDLKEIE